MIWLWRSRRRRGGRATAATRHRGGPGFVIYPGRYEPQTGKVYGVIVPVSEVGRHRWVCRVYGNRQYGVNSPRCEVNFDHGRTKAVKP